MNDEVKHDMHDSARQGYYNEETAVDLDILEDKVEVELVSIDLTSTIEKKPIRYEVFKLLAEKYNIVEIAQKLQVSESKVEDIIQKDKQKIKIKELWVNCLDNYRSGHTLQEIGDKHGITRERVRQIVKKQLYVENGYGPAESRFHAKDINDQLKAIVSGSYKYRSKELVLEKIDSAKRSGIDPQYFESVNVYAVTVGVETASLKEFAPDVYAVIVANTQAASRKWHKYYSDCRMCHKTEYKHRGYGYCVGCYTISPEFKELQKNSHMKYRDRNLAKNKIYAEDYFNRPEVIERIEKDYDLKYFDGNRKAALVRDDHKCVSCGMTMDEKDKTGRPKVRVWHINGDKSDNALSNLGTYCLSCYTKEIRLEPINRHSRRGK
ncbi:MAG: hypothetical protein HZB75_01065 [Candidatus Saccharibacteria bacterium]|nr:MAG: hypothetical protein HZB75_01065 [Candidatus Saccharibacteria bacterium]